MTSADAIKRDLRSIEKSLAVLWTRDASRTQFLAGQAGEDVEESIVPKINQKGVRLYASLIRHGRQDLMKSIYPVCAKLLVRTWQKLVDRYMETCPPDHYHLNTAAKAFPEFLRKDAPELVNRHPFLPELAEYEWLELEVMEADGKAVPGEKIALDSPEVFQTYGPVPNPVLVVRNYQYNVAKIVDWIRDEVRLPRRVKKDAVCLAIYRDPEELNARFLELGKLAGKVIDRVQQSPCTYAELLALAISESQSKDPQETVVKAIELFEQLQELNLFLGSKRVS